MENVALLVMSCDKYSSAWYPYFELLKKFWPDHPQKIYLSTETRNYSCPGIDITVLNSNTIQPWSQRLLNVLQHIKEEYIIFSLEDFFLLGYVDTDRIIKCINWMEEDSSIAECRLSTFETVTKGEFYKKSLFRICPKEHKYRIDTQIAIWRKSFLMSIINETETPWQFEGNASTRSRVYSDKLLWFSPDDPNDLKTMIVPYYNDWKSGYGIGWGKWRSKNKKWFNENGIKGVKYHILGTLSDGDVDRRLKYLYSNPTSLIGKITKVCYRFFVYSDRIVREIFITGIKGIKNILCIVKSNNLN